MRLSKSEKIAEKIWNATVLVTEGVHAVPIIATILLQAEVKLQAENELLIDLLDEFVNEYDPTEGECDLCEGTIRKDENGVSLNHENKCLFKRALDILSAVE